MPVIPATLETTELQLKANLGKVSMRLYLSNKLWTNKQKTPKSMAQVVDHLPTYQKFNPQYHKEKAKRK
jgi:hypothetical protein